MDSTASVRSPVRVVTVRPPFSFNFKRATTLSYIEEVEGNQHRAHREKLYTIRGANGTRLILPRKSIRIETSEECRGRVRVVDFGPLEEKTTEVIIAGKDQYALCNLLSYRT